uniref:Uncharacterized protein n=1 Tax=Oryza punctata TaxID=4537 RepID=A0A0E0LGV7_ORYPU
MTTATHGAPPPGSGVPRYRTPGDDVEAHIHVCQLREWHITIKVLHDLLHVGPHVGNLKKECTKGKHICERGCLTCAYQFWGKVPHGTDHMRCL